MPSYSADGGLRLGMAYDITQPLFWYKTVFMIELLIAEHLFSSNLEKAKHFSLKMPLCLLGSIAIAFALPLVPGYYATAWYSSLLFLTMFAVGIGVLRICYKGSGKDIMFCAIAGYTVQHISQESFELFNILANLNGKVSSDFYGAPTVEQSSSVGVTAFALLVYFSVFIIIYAAAYILYGSKERGLPDKMKNSYMVIVSFIIILFDAIISSVVTYLVPDDASRLPVVMTHVYNIICCVLVMILLFELPKRIKAESELETVKRIHVRERQQYETSKENIDMINMKFHDLKHRIRDMSDGNAAVREIEGMIEVYDSAFKTGNDALDVILTEKSALCRKQDIKLSCITDGPIMNFMKDSDIYVLFGNMLDNAIEAVQDYPPEERIINVSVRAHNSLAIINVRNTCNAELVFKDGLPVTSKQQNREYHGIGLKSIRYLVGKYKGEMSIDTDNGMFSLNMVFPAKA